ncbi:hypothetical protein UA08_06163 [Talaromyces atroroseus]|uniref:Uncharacterized protein n=1 Tax=Talaromyces atroroseus TaxID=1441469 RepID=A0A225AYF5_TALAT|nr:hypothetical protein UA08_06163 [Talaromyces atroroseus]OKL58527.1 hypothetical protein UA08_06163 [Talaromyces atroroseus]
MSHFNWPHPPYAEDQPYAKSLLYVHVFQRGFQAGAGVGLVHAVYKAIRPATSATKSAAASTTTAKQTQFLARIGRACLVGSGVSMALLTARMWGLEQIEWQDRSWRLLENEGQVMHDRYGDWGAGLGVVSALVGGTRSVGWQMVVGRAGVGALAGAVVCAVVRRTTV